MRQILPIFLFLICLLSIDTIAQEEAPKTKKNSKEFATDKAEISPAVYDYSNAPYKGISKESFYLEMRDGIKIAVDLYLPKNINSEDKLPLLIHQTRYWRSPQINFPFNLFTNGLIGSSGKMIESFVANGYAIINVDARGSGASFGSRAYPWTEDEIQDGYEIVDWAIKQDWCTGQVGSLGGSYSGTAAEFLATTEHPNLKAVALLFSLFDVYEDNAFPGGIHHTWFTENWGEANNRMDNNELPINYKKFSWLIGGVSKVKTKNKKQLLTQAIAAHQENRNVHDGALSVDFRDDNPDGESLKSLDVFSPHAYLKELNNSGVAIYSYSGWMDGAYQNAAIKRHLNLDNSNNKLIIGPWEHGGSYNISPHCRSLAGFDHIGELMKFFDFHLKNKKNGLDKEAAVHYFTMGEEKWKASESWPPADTEMRNLYFTKSRELVSEMQEVKSAYTDIPVSHNFGSGDMTRWKAVNGKINTAFMYHDWKEKSRDLISFETEVLEADLEITGHALFDLYMSFNKTDASIFVYLQDEDESGNVEYVTEGLLRASHSSIEDKGIYKEEGPARTHKRADAKEIKKGEIIQLKADLIPTSYLFKKGHKIKISIAGSDIDHFEIFHPDGYEMKLYTGEEYPSRIVLPVLQGGL